MSIVPLKTKAELISNLIAYIRSRHPRADLVPGTVMRDLLIESPAELIYNSQVLAEFISRLNNFNDLYDLLRDQNYKAQVAIGLGIMLDEVESIISKTIEGYASNFAIIRKTGQKASTIVTFSTPIYPSGEIFIPANTPIQTSSSTNALTFKTTQNAIIPSNPDESYINPENGQWEVSVTAEAEAEGTIYNIAPNTLVVFGDSSIVPQGVTVTNRVEASGGLNAESNSELLDRITYAYRGNFMGTPSNILASILQLSYVKDAEIVYQLDDPDRIRETSYEADIWITALDRTPAISEITMTADPYLTIPLTPVHSVTKVTDVTASSYIFTSNMYKFNLDEYSIYRYSSKAFDNITFIPVTPEVTTERQDTQTKVKLALKYGDQYVPFIDASPNNNISERITVLVNSIPDSGWKYSDSGNTIEKTFYSDPSSSEFKVKQSPKLGDNVRVEYYYNSRIQDAQAFITSDSRLFLGQDLLVREARPVPIVIGMTVQSNGSRSTLDLEEEIKNVLQENIVTFNLNREINMSDLVVLVKAVSGVLDVKLPLDILRRESDINKSGDILLSRFEYAVISQINVTIVTSRVVS